MIFKDNISDLQEIYSELYYKNYSLAARYFSEYENIAGFLNAEIDGTANLVGYFCTCVDPETYDVNGREIAITIEKSSDYVWYDGIASEFTVDDFTNDDRGYCYYKVINADTGDVWYSELMFIDKIIYPSPDVNITIRTVIIIREDGNVDIYPVDTASVTVDGTTRTSDSNGETHFVVEEGTYVFVVAAGSYDYDTGTNTGTVTWNEKTGSLDAVEGGSTLVILDDITL